MSGENEGRGARDGPSDVMLLICVTISRGPMCSHPVLLFLSPCIAEMMKAGLIDEMMNDALDSALDTEDMEEETEEQIEQVLAEIAGETAAALPNAKVRTHLQRGPHLYGGRRVRGQVIRAADLASAGRDCRQYSSSASNEGQGVGEAEQQLEQKVKETAGEAAAALPFAKVMCSQATGLGRAMKSKGT